MHPAISRENAPKLFHVSPLAWQARYRAMKAAAQAGNPPEAAAPPAEPRPGKPSPRRRSRIPR